MNFCRFTSKIPRNPIGCGFEVKYDFNKYNSYIEAIYADYIDCRTDEQLKESISLCFADSLDQKVMFKKLKLQFLSALANTDKA